MWCHGLVVLNPCATPGPAGWIVNSDLDWYDLAVFGPAGFDAYARLRFMPDPIDDDDDTDDQPDGPSNDQAKVERLCELLHSATSTPDDCYFAIWGLARCLRPHASERPDAHSQPDLLPTTRASGWLRAVGCPRNRIQPGSIRVAGRSRLVHCVGRRPALAGIGASDDTINRLLAQPDLNIVTADPDAGAPAL